MNVPRLMHALIWGKLTKENAAFLEKTRMEELDELEEAEKEIDNEIKAEKEEGIDEIDEKCPQCEEDFGSGNCFACKMD